MEDLINNVRAILVTTPTRWLNLIEHVPASLLIQKPNAKEWSALECLQHIVDTEQVFASRLQAFAEGKESFPAFDPDAQGSQGKQAAPSEIAERFVLMRRESLTLIDALSTGELHRRSRHSQLGPVTLSEMLHEWAGHDLNHTVQAERAMMQPFLRGCGPWIQYFTDHVIPED